MRSRYGRLATVAALALAAPAAAQTTLERAVVLDQSWVGLPGMLEAQLTALVRDAPTGLRTEPWLLLALGLPRDAAAGLVLGTESPLASEEVEGFLRWQPATQAVGAPVDAALHVGYNAGTTTVDAEVAVSRWLGPARVLAAGRALDLAGDATAALGAGAVLHPLPRRAPIALAADVLLPLDDAATTPVWSAALQVGISFTTHSLALFATNAASATLQGRSAAADTRWGVQLTAPVPVGRFFGWFVDREAAMRAVRTAEGAADVEVPIVNYLFAPARLVVDRGTVVRWVNRDEVVHTATADDASWNSGGIEPGRSWAARFSEPGVYPYHCGPHPFMRGVVIVRD